MRTAAAGRLAVAGVSAPLVLAVTASLLSGVGAPVARAETDTPARGGTVGDDPYLIPSGNGGIDVRHYDVRLRYRHGTRGIAAARVQLRIAALTDLTSFSLDARKGLRISRVRVGGQPAAHTHRDGELIVTGMARVPAGTVFRTDVRYRGTPRPLPDPSGRGKYGWLRTPGGVVTYSEPAATSSWVPSNDIFYDKATWRMTLITPRPLLGVSTGALLGIRERAATTVSRWDMTAPIQPYTQVVAVDRFRYSTKNIAGRPAFTAVAAGSGVDVAAMRRRTAAAIRWLEPRLGPYPFPSTGAIVVSGAESAMETAGRPTYSPDAYYVSRGTVVHEQAHQWFGNRLTAARSADIWLHEGFATYLQNVESAERRGRPLGDIVHGQYVLDGWSRGFHGQFERVTLADPGIEYLLNTTPYFRGQAAVHALRHEVGEQRFWQMMRGLVRIPPGETTDTAAVIAAAQRLSGLDLTRWADTWVHSTGYQVLPEPPSHRQVLREIGPGIMNAASDFVWKPQGSVSSAMQKARRNYSPMNHAVIDSVRRVRAGGRTRYLVDFHTSTGALYPAEYRSCFVFQRGDQSILAGAYLGVHVSARPAVNRFMTAPCPAAG